MKQEANENVRLSAELPGKAGGGRGARNARGAGLGDAPTLWVKGRGKPAMTSLVFGQSELGVTSKTQSRGRNAFPCFGT